jgi:acetyl esterase
VRVTACKRHASAAACAAALALSCVSAGASELRRIDDSYTISQRYYAYRDEYPHLKVPALEFQAGQQILFDRLYKKLGERELHLDVFLPKARRATRQASGQAVVLVHGGGWRSGNKSNFYAMANMLAQRGYAVFLPEFRLSPEAAYPAGLVDINDAIVWIKQHARDFGIDPRRVAIGGESSGGQMAALLAYTADQALFKTQSGDDTRVNALVDLDGVLDFTTPLALQYENAAGSNSVAAQWLGGAMEQATDKWREASAARHVNAQSPPTLIIAGGQPRFTAGKDEVLAALARHGIRNHYFAFAGAPHTFWLFEPYLSQVVDKTDQFLRGRPMQ